MQLHKLTCSYIGLHGITWPFVQVNELAYSSLSLPAVLWACMQFPELAWSSMSIHEVPWACMQFHELACSFMGLNAVPFFVWAAHKNFAVLVIILLFLRLLGAYQMWSIWKICLLVLSICVQFWGFYPIPWLYGALRSGLEIKIGSMVYFEGLRNFP